MQGGLWNQYTDPIEGEKFDEIYTQNKDKIRGQNTIQNDTICNKYTPHMCHRATQSMKILCKQIIGLHILSHYLYLGSHSMPWAEIIGMGRV